MENDGLNTVHHKKDQRCPSGMHEDVPIIEGSQTVGLVCRACGRRVREDMRYSSLMVTPLGLTDGRQRAPSRKDPRF